MCVFVCAGVYLCVQHKQEKSIKHLGSNNMRETSRKCSLFSGAQRGKASLPSGRLSPANGKLEF